MSKGKRTFVIAEKPPNLEKELLKIEKKNTVKNKGSTTFQSAIITVNIKDGAPLLSPFSHFDSQGSISGYLGRSVTKTTQADVDNVQLIAFSYP